MRLSKVISSLSILFILGSSLVSFAQEQIFLDLMKELIDLNGWDAEPANGMEVGDADGEIIIAMRDYHSDNKLLHVQIAVGKSAKKAWAQYDKGENIDTQTILRMTKEDSGHKIGVSYEKNTNSGSIVVPLKVKNSNAVFSLAFVGMSYQDALDIAKRFPLSNIESKADKK
jgi:hypothetical protein